jgi:LysR family transcriptional regulator, hydrogen peroxide-inducible genes activator
MLTLRQLRYLDALARHGNFGRAAEECGISQPALSMQIRELEQELGATIQRDLKRARIVLLAAAGRSTRSIAKEVGRAANREPLAAALCR